MNSSDHPLLRQRATTSPDKRFIARAATDHTIEIYDQQAQRKWLTYYGHQRGVYHETTGTVTALAWSPSGDVIASGSSNGEVQVWNPRTGIHLGLLVPQMLSRPIEDLCWSAHGIEIKRGGEEILITSPANTQGRSWNEC